MLLWVRWGGVWVGWFLMENAKKNLELFNSSKCNKQCILHLYFHHRQQLHFTNEKHDDCESQLDNSAKQHGNMSEWIDKGWKGHLSECEKTLMKAEWKVFYDFHHIFDMSSSRGCKLVFLCAVLRVDIFHPFKLSLIEVTSHIFHHSNISQRWIVRIFFFARLGSDENS